MIVLLCPHTRGYIPSEEDLETCLRDIEVFKKRDSYFLIGFIDQTTTSHSGIGKIRAAHPDIHLHNGSFGIFRDIQQTVETAIALVFFPCAPVGTNAEHHGQRGHDGNHAKYQTHHRYCETSIAVLLTGGITPQPEFIMSQMRYLRSANRKGSLTRNSYSPWTPKKWPACDPNRSVIF